MRTVKEINYTQLVDAVKTYLRDKQPHRVAINRIVDHVMGTTGYSNTAAIRTIVYAMIADGTVDGFLPQGKRKRRVYAWHKASETNHESNLRDPNVRYLREQLAQARKDAEQARKDAEQAKKSSTGEPDEIIVEIEIKQKGKATRKVEGLFHSEFPTLVELAEARENVFLYGPTGSGKTHVCAQLAEALGLPFYYISCTAGMSEGQLTGRLLPIGKGGQFEYVRSDFVRAYEEGGVFLLDEIDAADPNVLLIVNSALANGSMSVPNRPDKPYAERHKDFVCIAAANTVGTGADRQYSGRAKLDASTLDRFAIGKVYVDYDRAVEKKLCPDEALRNRLWRYREAVVAHRLERAVSTRFLARAHRMRSDYDWSDEKIDAVLFRGWREDEVEKVRTYQPS